MSDTAADTKSGSNEDTRKVRLRSAEGDSYELPYESALLSILVKNTIEVEDSDEDADGDDDDDDKDSDIYEIDIPKVSSNTLAYVVKYMRHYVEEEAMEPLTTPLSGNDIKTIFASEPWYRDYIENMDRPMVFKIVQAANYMEIQVSTVLCVESFLFMCRSHQTLCSWPVRFIPHVLSFQLLISFPASLHDIFIPAVVGYCLFACQYRTCWKVRGADSTYTKPTQDDRRRA